MINNKIINKCNFLRIIIAILVFISLVIVFSIGQFINFNVNINKIYSDSNLENFSYLELYGNPLNNDDIEILNERGIKIERIPFKEILKDNVKYHLFEDISGDINKPYIQQGKLPSSSSEIAINSLYASSEKLSVGDKMEIDNFIYTISGIVLLPNYSTPIADGMVPITSIDYMSVPIIVYQGVLETDVYYVAGKSDLKSSEIKEEISKFTSTEEEIDNNPNIPTEVKLSQKIAGISDGLYMFQMTNENVRITHYVDEFTQIINILTYIFIASILAMIFSLFLYITYVTNINRKVFGVLYSLGYKNGQVGMKLFLSVIFTFLSGAIAASFVYIYFIIPFINSLFSSIYFINLSFSIIWIIPLILLALLIFISVISIISIYRANNMQIVDIIRNSKKSNNLIKLPSFKNGIVKLRVMEYLTVNKYIVIFLVIVLTIATTLSALFINTYNKLSNDIGSVSLTYNNAVYYERLYPEGKNNTFVSLRTNMEDQDKSKIQIFGIDFETEYVNLVDEKGSSLNHLIDEGLVINKSLSKKYNISIGDEINFYNPVTKFYQTEVVRGINTIPWHNFAYISKERLNNYLGLDKQAYNAEYTLDSEQYIVDNNEKQIAFIENKEALVDGFKSRSDRYGVIAIITALLNIFIFICIIIFIVNTNIYSNKNKIAVLFSLGYKDRSIYKNIVSTYLIDVIISVVISTFITFMIYTIQVNATIKRSIVIPPNDFNIFIHLGIILFFISIYIIISRILYRLIKKLDIASILKEVF